MSLQITGADEVLKALENGVEVKLVLVDREENCSEIIELCESKKKATLAANFKI